MTVADLLVQILADEGVRRIYGVPGDSLNALTDAIRRNHAMDWTLVRNEEAGAFAAGAEAALTGGLAACAGSCGPGNLHLINGLYDCHRTRVPVLAIAAHIPSHEIGTQYFQETHPERLFIECSAYTEVVSHPKQLARMARAAIGHALAKRDVAVLVIPGDVALAHVDPIPKPFAFARDDGRTLPSIADLAAATGALDDAKRVTILAGVGCADARRELFAVADLLQAPIVHTLRGKERLEYDNPFDVGLTGLIGYAAGHDAMTAADALLMVGTDFPYEQFFPKHTPTVQIDVRGENIGRRTNVTHPLVGDAKSTLAALAERLAKKTDRAHLDKHLAAYRKTREHLDEAAKIEPGHTPIHPQALARAVSEAAADDAIFTFDVGTPAIWAARYLRMNGERRLLGSWSHGSMANAIPQAIGAQKAHPDRQVITFSGDGGLAMLMGELLTIVQAKLPINIVVFDNGALGFVELEMKAAGILDYGTELHNPDFAKIAEAIGFHATRVEDPGDLASAIADALAHDGPSLLDVVVNRQELSMPPNVTLEEALGFSAYSLRAVLSGRGNELVELVKTNVFR